MNTEVKIIQPGPRHAELMSRYYLDNEARFRPWNPRVPPGHHAVAAWRSRLKEVEAQFHAGRAVHFVGLDARETRVLGACSLTNIIRGPFQACFMGYSVDGDCEGRGVMTRIVRHVIDYAFGELGLHRIMANHMPANKRSERLLDKLGFEREGYARDYLKINGRWEDHVLTALVRPSMERERDQV